MEERQMSRDPVDQFHQWFQMAVDRCPGDWFDPTAMTLATASTDGEVTARIVLMKDFGKDGVTFYTNYTSRKGRQISQNPRAAMVFHWPYLRRQVRIEGTLTRLSHADSERYFWSRPRASQIAAAVSDQSQVIPSRQFLEERFSKLQSRLGNAAVPLPDYWGGYLL